MNSLIIAWPTSADGTSGKYETNGTLGEATWPTGLELPPTVTVTKTTVALILSSAGKS